MLFDCKKPCLAADPDKQMPSFDEKARLLGLN
jgi:hypothetical protein